MEAPEKVTLSKMSAKPRDPKCGAEEGKSFAHFPGDDLKPEKGYWMPNGGGCILDCRGQSAGGLLARMAKAKKEIERKTHHRKSGEQEVEPEAPEEEVFDGLGENDEGLVSDIYREIFTLVLRKTHKVDLHDVRLVLRGAVSVAVVNSGILGKKKDLIDESGLPIKPLLGPVTAEQLHVGLTQLTLKLSGDDWEMLQRFDQEAEEIGFAQPSDSDVSEEPKQKKCCFCFPGGQAKVEPEPAAGDGGKDKLAADEAGDLSALAAIEEIPPQVEMEYDPELAPPEPGTLMPAPPPLYPHPDDDAMQPPEQQDPSLLPGGVDMPPEPPEPPPVAEPQVEDAPPEPKKPKKKRHFGTEGDVDFEKNNSPL